MTNDAKLCLVYSPLKPVSFIEAGALLIRS
jgi:hypothetical protein